MATVKWYGDQLLVELEGIKRAALRKAGALVVKDAKALCPVSEDVRGIARKGKSRRQIWTEREPGTLRASIRYRIVKNGSKVQVIGGQRYGIKKGSKKYLGRMPYYGGFVELGTVKMAARPFLRPALERNGQRIVEFFRDQLK